MIPLADLLPFLLVPAAPVVAARAALAAAGRARAAPLSPAAADGAIALAVAAGILAALLVAGVRPAFPLVATDAAWTWVFWFAPIGAAIGVVETRVRVGPAALVAGRLGIAAGAAWLVLSELSPRWVSDAARWGRIALAAGVIAGVWSALAAVRDAPRARAVAVSTVVAVAGAAFVLLRVGRSGAMAHAMASFWVALIAAVVPITRGGALRFPEAAAPVVALVVGALTVAGFPASFAGPSPDFRVPTAVLLALAPVLGHLVPRRAPPALAIPLAALLAALVVAAAIVVSGASDVGEPAPDGY